MADDTIPVGIEFKTTGAAQAGAALDTLAAKGDKLDQSLERVEEGGKTAGKSLDTLGASAKRADANLEELSRSSSSVGDAMGFAKSALVGFAGAFGVAQFIQLSRAFLASADATTNLNTQLKLATGSAADAARAYTDLLAVAQRSRVNFVELGNTYSQIARATADLGLSGKDTLRVTETLAKAITISGVSASSAQAAMVQLSQGLASGTLRGEELNSILEQTPRVARALADGLGVSIGKLREMGAAGQLTGEAVTRALLDASKAIDQEFGQAATTVGQAVTVLGNATTDLVRTIDNLTGSSKSTASTIVSVATAMGDLSRWVDNLNDAGVPPIIKALASMGAFGAAVSGNPLNIIPGYAIANALIESDAERDKRLADLSAKENAPFDAIMQRRAKEAESAMKAANAANAAVDAFVNAKGNLTRAELKQADQNALLTEFAQKVKGFAQDSTQYLRAFSALQTGLANIDAKYAKRGGGDAGKAAREAARAERELMDALFDSLGVRKDYSEQVAQYETLLARGTITTEQYVKAIRKLAEAQPVVQQQRREEAEITRELEKAEADYVKTRMRSIEADANAASSLDATIKKLSEERAEIGLTTEQLTTLRAERLNEADAQEIQRLQSALDDPRAEADVANMQKRIDKLREIIALRSSIASGQNQQVRDDALAKAAKDAADAWQRTADEINRALTDSLFRSAEAGKSYFESLRDAIKGMFANMVLRPILQATVGTVTGALGLTGAAQAATGASGVGSIGSLAGLGGSLGLFGSGFSSGLSAWSAGGSVTGLLSQGSNLFAGGLANGLGTIAGALAPIALGIGTLVTLFSREGGGPKTGGQSIIDVDAAGVIASALQTATAADGGRLLFTPAGADADIAKLTAGIGASVGETLARFGATGRVTLGLGFDRDPQGDAGNRLSSFVSTAAGDAYRVTARSLGDDEAALQTAIKDEASRLTLAALQAADLPGGYADILKRLDPATAAPEAIAGLLDLVESIRAFGEAMGQLPGVMGTIADLSATAREELIKFAGGLDVLQAAQAAYYSQFFSDEERAAQARTNLVASFADLKIAFDKVDTRAEFRQIVEALDLTTEAGRQQYAALIQLAGPLDAWIDATDALAVAAGEAADATDALRESLQTEMDALVDVSGDLSKSLAELENPARTIADQFLALGESIRTLEDGLAQFLGTAVPSLLDQLTAAGGRRDNILGAQASLGDTITDTRLRGFLNRGDLQGGIGLLKSVEATLFADLATTADPAGVTAQIVAAMTQRYDLEAQLITDARELRADALQDEISRLETLRGVIEQIDDTLLSLRTGSLSALAPRDQLAVSSSDFMSVLAAAQAGDIGALQKLSGSGTQYLTEAQSFFASGGDYASIFSNVTGALESVGTSLGDVPTQIGVAQDQLLALDTVVDNTGEMLTDFEALSGTLATLYTSSENAITTLVSDIHALIADMKVEREGLQMEYDVNRARWTALDERLQSIDGGVKTIASNATLAAAA